MLSEKHLSLLRHGLNHLTSANGFHSILKGLQQLEGEQCQFALDYIRPHLDMHPHQQRLFDFLHEPSLDPYKLDDLLLECKILDDEICLRYHNLVWNHPESWTLYDHKVAWAFQGLLGKPLVDFDQQSDYAVFLNEPYLIDTQNTFHETIRARQQKSDPLLRFHDRLDIAETGHIVCVPANQKKKLSKQVQEIIDTKAKPTSRNFTDEPLLAFPLEYLPLSVTKEDQRYLYPLLRGKSDGSLLGALRLAFEVPDSPKELYPRMALHAIFDEPHWLYPKAEQWLYQWVKDEKLATHLSCFVEEKRGGDRCDIYLDYHCDPSWEAPYPDPGCLFSGIVMDGLKYFDGCQPLLGWEYEHIDIPENIMVVAIPPQK